MDPHKEMKKSRDGNYVSKYTNLFLLFKFFQNINDCVTK